jgi:aminopeptidase N
MWFGDLVTMKWWNDLWLKESFATYLGAICLIESEALRHYRNPEQLFIRFTCGALEADAKSTTHPVQVQVQHTTDAENVFDRICYDKGASFIKQLSHFIGRDVLEKGS